MKYSPFLIVLSLLWCFPLWAQAKYEREFRIKQADFPQKALALIKDEIQGVKRLRFYKEIDSITVSFEAKFKKDRLFYSIEFNTEGELEDIEILIQESDIPNDVLEAITAHLMQTYSNFKIRKIQQQYPLRKAEQLRGLLKEAFQNLLLPSLNYNFLVSIRTEDGNQDYKFIFDSEGTFKYKKPLLPANYDHILY